jgi:WD40-like Beta Propeller Repeat
LSTRWYLVPAVVVACGGCNGILGIVALDSDAPDGGGTCDASPSLKAPEPPPTTCDRNKPFGTPAVVRPLSTPSFNEYDARLTVDELTIYFARNKTGGATAFDPAIYVATRSSYTDAFGDVKRVDGLRPANEAVFAPSVTSDGLTMYFDVLSGAPGTSLTILSAKRPCSSAPFSIGAAVPNVNGKDENGNPIITPDGASLYFFSNYWADTTTFDSGGHTTRKLVVARRNGDSFATPEAITSLDTAEADNVAVSANQLEIAFASTRGQPSGGNQDIWLAERSSVTADWGTATLLATVSSASTDSPTWISDDGCRLYLQSNRYGTSDIFMAVRPP